MEMRKYGMMVDQPDERSCAFGGWVIRLCVWWVGDSVVRMVGG